MWWLNGLGEPSKYHIVIQKQQVFSAYFTTFQTIPHLFILFKPSLFNWIVFVGIYFKKSTRWTWVSCWAENHPTKFLSVMYIFCTVKLYSIKNMFDLTNLMQPGFRTNWTPPGNDYKMINYWFTICLSLGES